MEDVLMDLGLTKNEAKVYWKLLARGALCARALARECKTYRSSIYDSVERLTKKGLVSFIWHDKIRWFQAAEPETLVSWIQDKEQSVKALLPRLKLEMKLKKQITSQAIISEGIGAFRRVMLDLLEKQSPILVYGIPATVPSIVRYFIEAFHKQRAERKTLMRHIYNENALERIHYLNALPHTEARCLSEQYNSPVSTMICKDEVVLISWEPITLIRIKNESLAKAYENYFEILWEKAVEPRK